MPASLAEYKAIAYPFTVQPEETGFFIEYPDLPGCMTQVDREDEVLPAAREIRDLWLETAWETGRTIPMPEESPAYSGKFLVRIATSLHRSLALAAKGEGISLNQYAGQLLAQGVVLDDVRRQYQRLEHVIHRLDDRIATDSGRGMRLVAEDTSRYRSE